MPGLVFRQRTFSACTGVVLVSRRARKYVYDYPQMGTTADVVCFAVGGRNLKTVLIRRKNEPFKGEWVLPGGYVEINELFETAARRELAEETGLTARVLYPVGLFDAPRRDPRRRVITFAYYALFREEVPLKSGDDASGAAWVKSHGAAIRGFDHAQILAAAVRTLRRDIFLFGRHRELMTPDGSNALDVLAAALGSPAKAREVISLLGPDGGARLALADFPRLLAPLSRLFF